jgi:hypothetical protein
MCLLQERAHVTPPRAQTATAHPITRAMNLSNYASTTATTTPTTPRPRGHIWSTRLCSWVVPITRKGSRRPSPDHIFCSEPPCWLLIEPLEPEAAALPSAPHGATS